jgi:sarcosine oxidase, subunit delta
MLLINCPYCREDLPEVEFAYAGEAHIARPADPMALSDEEWRDYLFIRSNPRGIHFERWRHLHGCGRFFNAVRDTVSDKFQTTYKAGQPKPDLSPASASSAGKEPGA